VNYKSVQNTVFLTSLMPKKQTKNNDFKFLLVQLANSF